MFNGFSAPKLHSLQFYRTRLISLATPHDLALVPPPNSNRSLLPIILTRNTTSPCLCHLSQRNVVRKGIETPTKALLVPQVERARDVDVGQEGFDFLSKPRCSGRKGVAETVAASSRILPDGFLSGTSSSPCLNPRIDRYPCHKSSRTNSGGGFYFSAVL
jgi:hypothetical protein